jgi:hypothetical protein
VGGRGGGDCGVSAVGRYLCNHAQVPRAFHSYTLQGSLVGGKYGDLFRSLFASLRAAHLALFAPLNQRHRKLVPVGLRPSNSHVFVSSRRGHGRLCELALSGASSRPTRTHGMGTRHLQPVTNLAIYGAGGAVFALARAPSGWFTHQISLVFLPCPRGLRSATAHPSVPLSHQQPLEGLTRPRPPRPPPAAATSCLTSHPRKKKNP